MRGFSSGKKTDSKASASSSSKQKGQPKFFSFMGKVTKGAETERALHSRSPMGLPLSPSFRIKTLTTPAESLRTTFSKFRLHTDFTNLGDGDNDSIDSIREEEFENDPLYKDLRNFSEFSQKGVIRYQQGMRSLQMIDIQNEMSYDFDPA